MRALNHRVHRRFGLAEKHGDFSGREQRWEGLRGVGLGCIVVLIVRPFSRLIAEPAFES